MTVAKENSYDYANNKRDLSDAFEVIVKSKPVLSELIAVSTVPASNTKHEWLEDMVTPKSWTLNGAYTAGGNTMTVDTSVGIQVGAILTFEEATGASTTITVKVLTVPDATSFTFSLYGDDTVDQNLADNAIVKLVAQPKNESTVAGADDGREQTVEYNYTQIMDRTAVVSKTSQAVKTYGIASAIDYQVNHQLQEIAYELVSSIIYGKRVVRTSSDAGSFGGILYYLGQAPSNKVDASAAAISSTLLNDGLALGNENGALALNAVIGHPDQIRKIGAFNQNNIQISREDRGRGTYVTEYVGDLGDITVLIADRNFVKDKVALVDTTKLSLVPLENRAFSDEDATPNGADYFARRILGEYTLQLKNANTHILIENLAI